MLLHKITPGNNSFSFVFFSFDIDQMNIAEYLKVME